MSPAPDGAETPPRQPSGHGVSVGFLRLLRRVALVLALIGSVGTWGWAVLWYKYYDTLPRSPQPATGRTYVMNMHGVPVYATWAERHRLDLIENLSFILLLAGFVGAILTDPDYRQRMGWRSIDQPSDRPRRRSQPPAGPN